MEMHLNDKIIGQSITKSLVALKRHMNQLFEELDKIEAAEFLEQNEESELTATTTLIADLNLNENKQDEL
jgi:hypothetical protein